jgi:hypothetical protein
MRRAGKFLGLSLIAIALAAPTAAQADPGITANLVDGTISISSTVCSWTNAATSDNPPNTLTIDRNTVNRPTGNVSCNDGTTVTLNNNPVAIFNDSTGTATADRVSVTATQGFVTCTFEATGVTLTRSGTTRSYSGSFTARKTSGSFLCPTSGSGSATLNFH